MVYVEYFSKQIELSYYFETYNGGISMQCGTSTFQGLRTSCCTPRRCERGPSSTAGQWGSGTGPRRGRASRERTGTKVNLEF